MSTPRTIRLVRKKNYRDSALRGRHQTSQAGLPFPLPKEGTLGYSALKNRLYRLKMNVECTNCPQDRSLFWCLCNFLILTSTKRSKTEWNLRTRLVPRLAPWRIICPILHSLKNLHLRLPPAKPRPNHGKPSTIGSTLATCTPPSTSMLFLRHKRAPINTSTIDTPSSKYSLSLAKSPN